ncbi:MAG: YkgJ family cysteine cluster protein [Candidatus Bathyarchaeota archaeon]|nr:MAG: YkgJ family cysteine cluster protein [Candidatus Bathyarchaeota archaeon]
MKKAILRTSNLERNEELARITLNPKTMQILNIIIYERKLRFKCRRCATFCCRLGGPKLTRKDALCIAQGGYAREEFLIPFRKEWNSSSTFLGDLRSNEEGSCIFLKFNSDEGNYECSIYDSRPSLCKLYPFDFRNESPQSISLGLIPCCRGLNNPDGELVDEGYIMDSLFDPISDFILRHVLSTRNDVGEERAL